MEEYIKNIDLNIISNQTLAFIGDGIYNVYIRTYLASKSCKQTGLLHKDSVRYVSAKAQSKIIDLIYDKLVEEEIDVYKRGRNTNVGTISKKVDVLEYKKATGFEALIGYIYLKQKINRLEDIINMSIKAIEGNI